MAKRTRRTQSQVAAYERDIHETAEDIHPCTIRQLYYQLVTRGLIDKTDRAYQQLVRQCTIMRRAGRLPFTWFVDNTRWMHAPTLHRDLRQFIDEYQTAYRRDLWRGQNVQVQVWIEKDALTGVFYDVTEQYGVPLFPCRGYPSLSFLHSAAVQLATSLLHHRQQTYLYYFGDHDPSGQDIPRSVHQQLQELTAEHLEKNVTQWQSDIDSALNCLHFELVAVTAEQIRDMGLPTRPTKRTDSRAKNWQGGSVELDAIHPDKLRDITRELITQHIDDRQWQLNQQVEREERAALAVFGQTV